MSRRSEKAAASFHNQALLEAQKYAQSHGGDILQEVAHGRGLKTGFIQGYEQAEKDTIERIREQVKQWMPEEDREECTNGERLAFNSVLHLLEEMKEEKS